MDFCVSEQGALLARGKMMTTGSSSVLATSA
jgi:hypothetical protein